MIPRREDPHYQIKFFLFFMFLTFGAVIELGALFFWTNKPFQRTYTKTPDFSAPMPMSVSGNNFVIISKDVGPMHIDMDVAISQGRSKKDMLGIADKIIKQNTSGKWLSIDFYEANGTKFGNVVDYFDSRTRNLMPM